MKKIAITPAINSSCGKIFKFEVFSNDNSLRLPCETAEIRNLFILIIYKYSECYILPNAMKETLFSVTSVPILSIKGNLNLVKL